MAHFFTGWPIRKKLALGAVLLLIAVSILAFGGFSNAYSFRGLVRSISRRATELPDAVTLVQHVAALRATVPTPRLEEAVLAGDSDQPPVDRAILNFEFERRLRDVSQSLAQYRSRVEENAADEGHVVNLYRELETVQQMEAVLHHLERLGVDSQGNWLATDSFERTDLSEAVEQLNLLAEQLPRQLQQKMNDLQGDVRGYYRTWIVLTWLTSISAGLLFVVLIQLFLRWVFRPLEQLIRDSRQIAGGDFDHRIHLNSGDEMDELAQAMNDMTGRFQQIRDDLDQQVKQRTREVIRGEQLASVGFLAAGVAHEINNPLASIALCAESLEERVTELVAANRDPDDALDPEEENNADVVQDYLRMIQEEAFRCKEITGRLLDFSRLGDVEKQEVNLGELVQGVIDMVRHLGNYKQKLIEYVGEDDVQVPVNAQEMKQVVLNLITNGLDSLDPGGTVQVRLTATPTDAVLVVKDNGCGMTEEVKAHLFEPFFTRRRDGQGTGLGMSITYRIINEHGGQILVHSDGPGHGSQLVVRLPLQLRTSLDKEMSHRHQAA